MCCQFWKENKRVCAAAHQHKVLPPETALVNGELSAAAANELVHRVLIPAARLHLLDNAGRQRLQAGITNRCRRSARPQPAWPTGICLACPEGWKAMPIMKADSCKVTACRTDTLPDRRRTWVACRCSRQAGPTGRACPLGEERGSSCRF